MTTEIQLTALIKQNGETIEQLEERKQNLIEEKNATEQEKKDKTNQKSKDIEQMSAQFSEMLK